MVAVALDVAPPRGDVSLARALGDLHQLIYTRGGIRPVNAAVEELAKLLYLRIAAARHGDVRVPGYGCLRDIVTNDTASADHGVTAFKAAFTVAIAIEPMMALLPDRTTQTVWPIDEPFRITRPDVIAQAFDVLSSIPLDAVAHGRLDPLGTAFDVFLQGRYDHAGGLGTYLTPEPVAVAMAKIALDLVDPLAEPIDGPVIGDPCAGTGRFIIAALHELESRVVSAKQRSRWDSLTAHGLLAADQSTAAVGMARVNLLAYGLESPTVFTVEDSITDRNLDRLKGSLRLILTNPPFGEGKYDSAEGIRRARAVLPSIAAKSRIDPSLAFVSRSLELLAPGGILGIILPDGVADGPALRSALFDNQTLMSDEISVEAAISLPTATFALAGTVARTTAVFIRRGRPRSSKVVIARADHVGYLKQAGNAAPDPEGNDLVAIESTARCHLAAPDNDEPTTVVSVRPMVAVVRRGELTSLDPGNLDPSALASRAAMQSAGACELRLWVKPVGRRRIRVPSDVPFVSVLHVDKLGVVDWVEARDYRPTTPGIVARAGEILVSLLNPSNLRATVIPERYPLVQCSAEFGVFEASVDPYGILALIQSQDVRAQLAPLGRGTSSSRRRIDPEDVLKVLVPDVDASWLNAKGRELHAAIDVFIDSRLSLAANLGR